MVRKVQERLTAVLAFLAVTVVSFAQNSSQTDSLVRLMNAKSLELIQQNGEDFRKAVDATFLHNGTYLICDTALWDVSRKVIKCQGNVQLLQDETILTSEKLDYLIDEDLAQFRGQVVQLANKKNNILRTRNLDYNTRDSLAVFRGGAAMRDEDGQVIESDDGTYDSAGKYFTFRGNVNMFTDSVFVKTTVLEYDSDASRAKFVAYVDFWKEDNMLSAGDGWYDHNREVFFFRNDVHGLTKEQESWSDSIYFYRNTNDVLMLGNAHVQDSTRNVAALADYIFYQDSLSRVTLRKRAAVALKNEQGEKVDTVYCGADTLVYQTIRRCDIPGPEIDAASRRLAEMTEDAVSAYRKRAAQEAEEAIRQKIRDAEEEGVILPGLQSSRYAYLANQGEESGASAAPSSSSPPPEKAQSDSLAVAADSLAVSVPDTTKIGFLRGVGNVKIFKSDMQVMCDSLRYSDLDSIARFYNKPLVWNEEVRQYSSDSLFVLIKGGKADRASLMSNAFITCEESDIYYDQIKSTDIVAFFGENTELSRFDALGGVNALFYLQENETIATVNRVECKMMSATMKDGNLERVYYYSQPHNDAYPVVQLSQSEHRLKGYDWQPDARPKSREDVTTLEVMPSERTYYQGRPGAEFHQTDFYFPGYMAQVHKDIEASRERKARAEKESAEKERVKEASESDSPEASPDSLSLTDTLALSDSLAVADTIALADSLAVTDSLSVADPEKTVVDPREQRREEQELARKMRIARRDAIWAEKDARDAAKAEAKAQRALEKKRKRTKLLYLRQLKQDEEDAAKLQKYIEKYQKQKDRKDERDKEAD